MLLDAWPASRVHRKHGSGSKRAGVCTYLDTVWHLSVHLFLRVQRKGSQKEQALHEGRRRARLVPGSQLQCQPKQHQLPNLHT